MQKKHRGIIEALLLLACAIWIVSRCEERVPIFKARRDTVTVVKSDTIIKHITIRAPKPDTAYVVKTIRIPVRDREEKNDTTMQNQPDSMALPITQKVYSDSTYTAYVSGYSPSLDSIFVRQKVITNTIHEKETIEVKKFRRWNVGLVGGYGYGFQSKTFEPFIGVGVTWNIFK